MGKHMHTQAHTPYSLYPTFIFSDSSYYHLILLMYWLISLLSIFFHQNVNILRSGILSSLLTSVSWCLEQCLLPQLNIC